jgi:hypothetical protein
MAELDPKVPKLDPTLPRLKQIPRRNAQFKVKVKNFERKLTALRLRAAGKPMSEIAAAVGANSCQAAYALIRRAYREVVLPEFEHYKNLEIARLDGYLESLQPAVAKGDIAAIQTALKVAERRSKLLGLDEPEKRDVTTGGEPIKVIFGMTEEEITGELGKIERTEKTE